LGAKTEDYIIGTVAGCPSPNIFHFISFLPIVNFCRQEAQSAEDFKIFAIQVRVVSWIAFAGCGRTIHEFTRTKSKRIEYWLGVPCAFGDL